MADYTGAFSCPGTSAEITLYGRVNLVSQNAAANTSYVSWEFFAQEHVNANPYRLTASSAGYMTCYVPVFANSAMTYDFRATNAQNYFGSGYVTVPHDAAGNASFSVSGSFSDAAPQIIGSASFSGTYYLPNIPPPIVGDLDYYNGTAWALQHLEYYNGTAWAAQTVEYYNGSAWVRQI